MSPREEVHAGRTTRRSSAVSPPASARNKIAARPVSNTGSAANINATPCLSVMENVDAGLNLCQAFSKLPEPWTRALHHRERLGSLVLAELQSRRRAVPLLQAAPLAESRPHRGLPKSETDLAKRYQRQV